MQTVDKQNNMRSLELLMNEYNRSEAALNYLLCLNLLDFALILYKVR